MIRRAWAAGVGLACILATAPALALVGPTAAGDEVRPYVVMVLSSAGRLATYCSGLVVAPDAILTAAHCVPPGAALKVHYRAAEDVPVLLDVAAVERHPAYRPDAIRTRERSIDLALVRLAAPLPAPFRPAPYGETGPHAAGTRFRLAGFGLTREGDPRSSGRLGVATVEQQDPASVVLLWARDPTGHGAGACTGDSGGPVFAADRDVAAALMIWSAGKGASRCGLLTQAVWLEPQRAWIDGVLARWGAASR